MAESPAPACVEQGIETMAEAEGISWVSGKLDEATEMEGCRSESVAADEELGSTDDNSRMPSERTVSSSMSSHLLRWSPSKLYLFTYYNCI